MTCASLGTTVNSTSTLLFILPAGTVHMITGRITSLLSNRAEPRLVRTDGKLRRSARGQVSIVVRRRVPARGCSDLIILSKPDRTRRITGGSVAAVATTSRSRRSTTCIRGLFVGPCFEICQGASIVKIRLNTTLGGVVTMNTKTLRKLNCNSGTGTTLVAHKLTRVDHLKVTFNTSPVAFFNLDNINSLVIANADHRSQG